MSAPLESPAPRRRRVGITPDPLRIGAMIAVMTITLGFSAWAVMPAFADDPVDLPPVAVDDYFSTPQDTAVSGELCSNDSDPEGGDLDSVSVSTPSVGTLTQLNGSLCSFTYEPPVGYSGTATFTYLAHDHVQSSVAPATVTIEIVPVAGNAAPVANGDAYTTAYGQVLAAPVSLLANDTDADGDALVVYDAADPSSGSISLDWDTGFFTFTPAPGFIGDATFTYSVWDGESASGSATVTITVLDDPTANHPPVAVGESYTIGAGQVLTIPSPGLIGNDSDPDGDTIDISMGAPVGGSLPGEQLTNTLDYAYTYVTPSGGWTGTRVWEYRVWDGEFYSQPATLTITVTAEPVEQATPVASDDEYTVDAGSTLTVAAPGPFANDSDADSSFSLNGYDYALHGDVTTFHPATGQFVYTPDAGYVGTETITYTLQDDNGNTSEPATITIHVVEPQEPVNSAPVANDDAYSVAYGETLVLPSGSGVLANDTDADGDVLEVVAATDPPSGQLTIGYTGAVTWVPAAGFTGTATFTYKAGDGALQSNEATVTITVGEPGENLAPTAVADAFTVPQGATLTVTSLVGLLVNDLDPEGDALLVSGASEPSVGTLSVGMFGDFVFTPPAGFVGVATFQYEVTDGTNESAWATVAITVSPTGTGNEPQEPSDDPTEEEPPTLPQAPGGTGDDEAGTVSSTGLASTGSSVSALGAFSALLLVAIGGVVLRHGRVRSRAR